MKCDIVRKIRFPSHENNFKFAPKIIQENSSPACTWSLAATNDEGLEFYKRNLYHKRKKSKIDEENFVGETTEKLKKRKGPESKEKRRRKN